MQRLKNDNVNTDPYWSNQYAKGMYDDLLEDGIKFIQIANHIEDGSKVVDFGCGNGALINTIKEYRPGCVITGVDFSKYAIDEINKAGFRGVRHDLNTPFTENGYDYAISCETLEHVDNPKVLVNSMYDCLKTGGKLILTTPYLDHIPSSEHIWEYDYKDIEEMLLQFSQKWVFPWGSGRGVITDEGIKYNYGNWDTIFALAIK